jgi:glucose/arabinose dehydrogenase
VAATEILGELGLREGDIVGSTAPDDPDIFIINEWGYKRLFLSPAIFSFYGHLRYENVRRLPDTVIESLPVSGLFRNCETGDRRVFALEVIAEDDAVLRWVNVSGETALAEEPDFFKKVFCINSREFGWYTQGSPIVSFAMVPHYYRGDLPGTGGNATGLPLTLPAGFRIGRFTNTTVGPLRMMAFSPDGILFASMPSRAGLYGGSGQADGVVYAFPDRNGDGISDETWEMLTGLRMPHGLAFHGGYLYVAEEAQVARYAYQTGGALGPRAVIAALPSGGSHLSRTIAFGPNGKMYVSVGSPCNDCTDGAAGTAAVWEFNADGTGGRVYAAGIRNAVGLAFNPSTGELWGTENGRDYLGDDLPPDELNTIRDGGHYGWPYCYGFRINDPKHPSYDCGTTMPSMRDLQAHSAPLGLAFVPPGRWGSLSGDLIVARHGSWNRTQPVGYDVIRVDLEGDAVVGERVFVSGWLTDSGVKLGRPVDVAFGPDGALYVSDDKRAICRHLFAADTMLVWSLAFFTAAGLFRPSHPA